MTHGQVTSVARGLGTADLRKFKRYGNIVALVIPTKMFVQFANRHKDN